MAGYGKTTGAGRVIGPSEDASGGGECAPTAPPACGGLVPVHNLVENLGAVLLQCVEITSNMIPHQTFRFFRIATLDGIGDLIM